LDILCLEGEITMLSYNIRTRMLGDAASCPRRTDASSTLLQKTKNLHSKYFMYKPVVSFCKGVWGLILLEVFRLWHCVAW